MGMVCLDAACGGGDVSLDLAGRVGPGGKVVGWDIDETKLGLARREAEEKGLGNLDFQLADIGHSESERGSSTPFTQGSCSPISRTQVGALARMEGRRDPGESRLSRT